MKIGLGIRVDKAVEAGEKAFWDAVVKVFPEATSGDIDIVPAANLMVTMDRAVKAWVLRNVPESKPRKR